ncbi:hypothetical protein J6590_000827 [Homalodisca vitripennis]|nr:hypothetical protein J6590_000827 [Homalodisca vitripennis]
MATNAKRLRRLGDRTSRIINKIDLVLVHSVSLSVSLYSIKRGDKTWPRRRPGVSRDMGWQTVVIVVLVVVCEGGVHGEEEVASNSNVIPKVRKDETLSCVTEIILSIPRM